MSAQIHSVDSLADFEAALQSFAEKAGEAMTSLSLEIQRVKTWLDDQAHHWKTQIRKAEEAVVKAKNELARKRMMKIGDRTPDTTDEEKALAKAKAWLQFGEQKLAVTRSWILEFPREQQNFESQFRPFQSTLEIDVPRMIQYLERKRQSLESYLQMSAPSPPRVSPTKDATP